MGKSSRVQMNVRSMVGSWEAWHWRVRLSPRLMSALDGARVILVASVGRNKSPKWVGQEVGVDGSCRTGTRLHLRPRKQQGVVYTQRYGAGREGGPDSGW